MSYREQTTESDQPIGLVGEFRSEQFQVSLSDYRFGLKHAWHSHERPILTLILAGHTREQVGARDVIASPLDIGLKPAGVRHTDQFGPNGLRAIRIEFSETLYAELGSEAESLDRWSWLSGSEAVRPLLGLARAILSGKSQPHGIAEAVYDSLAILSTAKSPRAGLKPPKWLEAARDRLEADFCNGVRLSQLAQDAGVHPVYLARQFRRYYGCSVGEYVRQVQFQAATSLLATSRVDLALIALKVGCADQAHLTRLFTARLGITPGQYRKLVA